jgi:hypothetical protein
VTTLLKRKHILAALKPVVAGASYQQQVIADGAFSYWPMNDVAAPIVDLLGLRNATVTGTPTYGVPGPRVATAISFARTGAASPPSAVPVGTVFTLEAWIRRTAVFPRAFIMGRAMTAQNDWYLAFNTSTGDRLQFAYRDAAATQTFFFPMTFNLNTWTYIVLVISGSTLQLYVNGVATGAPQALTVLGGAGSGTFQLAANSGAPSEAWGGQLADLAIYQLALTPAQILSHSTAI